MQIGQGPRPGRTVRPGRRRQAAPSAGRCCAGLFLAALGDAAPAAPTPTGAAPPARGTTAAPPAAAPRPPGQSAAWDAVVAAAKQEGKLALSGPPGLAVARRASDLREGLSGDQGRVQRHQLARFLAAAGAGAGAGQYLWDLRVGGPDPQVYQARDEGVLAPIRPLLALPDVTDDSKWLGGLDGLFVDNAHQYNRASRPMCAPASG